MLLVRILSAAVLAPIVIGALYLGGAPLLFVLLIAAGLAYGEFAAMFRQEGRNPFGLIGRAAVIALVASAYSGREGVAAGTLSLVVFVGLAWALALKRPPSEAVVDWALTLGGVLYVGWLLRHAYLLRSIAQGWEWSLVAILVTWAADTGAYLLGRAIGRHKMYPRISPGKTWEGAAGGILLAVVAALVFGSGGLIPGDPLRLPLWQSASLGILIAVVAMLGDLVESLIKRAAGAKDSGTLIPGHGGLLDRLDSLLFVLPVVYYFAVLVGRQ